MKPEDRKTMPPPPAMDLPEFTSFVQAKLAQLTVDLAEVARQMNLANGELYRRLENWREDLSSRQRADIDDAVRDHEREHHMNGNGDHT